MSWKHIFAKKDLEMLLAEMAGEHRLHRVLGPVGLTSLGIGCIIGAGIFVMTGRAAAGDAGPAVVVSYAVAGLGCAFAALCYAEFAAMAPVAGSAYTYAYTTLGEIFAWIIGWDLILEYAMGCATVASSWTYYMNEFLKAVSGNRVQIPVRLIYDPFTYIESVHARGWINLPSVAIVAAITVVLVIGIRESVRTNAILVAIKLLVVFFVIIVGCGYVQSANWTTIPVTERVLPEEHKIPEIVKKYVTEHDDAAASAERINEVTRAVRAAYRVAWSEHESARLERAGRMSPDQAKAMVGEAVEKAKDRLPVAIGDQLLVKEILPAVQAEKVRQESHAWGILGLLGLNQWLIPIDDAIRSPFAPYGLSGIMLGAAIVFFAYIGFDSISTHAEEARNPHRDLPIGILVSLGVCTILYMAVAAVLTGMIPYPQVDIKAPIAAAFRDQAASTDSFIMKQATALIAAGGLAGMTSVLLVLFLSQVRVLMAMARDGLLPKVFGRVHPRFRTPHVATMLTGLFICFAAALTPIKELEEMVNIGTLMAFVIVCAAVLILRHERPDAKRPFRCPILWVVAPLGMLVNASLMLFLPIYTWYRLGVWLLIGFCIYFLYSRRHSHLIKHLMHQIKAPRDESVDNENGSAAPVAP